MLLRVTLLLLPLLRRPLLLLSLLLLRLTLLLLPLLLGLSLLLLPLLGLLLLPLLGRLGLALCLSLTLLRRLGGRCAWFALLHGLTGEAVAFFVFSSASTAASPTLSGHAFALWNAALLCVSLWSDGLRCAFLWGGGGLLGRNCLGRRGAFGGHFPRHALGLVLLFPHMIVFVSLVVGGSHFIVESRH